MTPQAYIREVRTLYLKLPNTAACFSRSDRELAAELYRRAVPFELLRAAILLATARRLCRNPASAPLPPIRSLHYFLHTLDEVLRQPLPKDYVRYLESKITLQK